MFVSRMLTTAVLGLTLAAGAAGAQTVDQRHGNQQERISQGVASGRLTPGEAARLEHQQGRIDRAEDRMRARHSGRLTDRERLRLQQRENRASGRIYRDKHNGRGY